MKPLKFITNTKTNNFKTKIASWAFLVLFLFSASGVNASLYDERAASNQQIDALNAQLKEIKSQKASLANEVAAFDIQIQKTQTEINATQIELDIVTNEIASVEAQIKQAEADLKKQKEIMAEYLKTIYMQGQVSTVELIAKSDSFSDFVDQSEYLNTMQEKVQNTADKIVSLKAELDQKQKDLQIKRESIEQLRAQQVQQRNAIEAQREARNVVLVQTRGLESEYQNMLNNERNNKAELDRLIWNLENQDSGDNASTSGYIWPFPGYSKSTLRYGVGTFIPFGYSVYYFSGISHTGIDIYGSAIRSASNGTVAYAGWNGGYGNCVIVRNGDHLVFYGHLSSIGVSVGQNVNMGDYIGQEGTTGNSTGPHLHFEIRKNGIAVDPLNYLP